MTTPLTYWESLTHGVRASIAKNRVGTPVFVRWTLLVGRDNGELERLVAKMLETTGKWFGSDAVRVMALAPDKSCTLTVSAEFAAGQTALLTSGLSHQRAEIDFILLGNKGTSYQHEYPVGINHHDFAVPDSADIDVAIEQLRRSIASGSPTSPGS